MVLLAAVGLGACTMTGADQRGRPTDLVTRTSLGGIHLQDSQAVVEHLYGRGRNLHDPGPFAVHYSAGLTVYYAPPGTEFPGVFLVEATSPRFQTSTGVGLGSSLSAVKALGQMDCGPITQTRVE